MGRRARCMRSKVGMEGEGEAWDDARKDVYFLVVRTCVCVCVCVCVLTVIGCVLALYIYTHTSKDVCLQLVDAEASADPLHRGGSVTMRL